VQRRHARYVTGSRRMFTTALDITQRSFRMFALKFFLMVGPVVAGLGFGSGAFAAPEPATQTQEQAVVTRPDLRPSCQLMGIFVEFWQLRCKVYNDGGAATPETTTTIQYVGTDGERRLLTLNTRALPPGGFTLHEPVYLALDTPYKVTTDATGIVLESNETNNVLQCPPQSKGNAFECLIFE
jgi:hypothetical protein